MRGKLMFVAGAAVGYVLGARAGREQYDKLKAQAESVIHDPRVQDKVSQAGQTVKDKAPDVQAKVGEAAGTVKEKAGGAAGSVKDRATDAASGAKHRANGSSETHDSLIGEESGSDYSAHQTRYTSAE